MSRVAPFALVFALGGSAFAQQQPAPQPAPQAAPQVQAPPAPPSAPPQQAVQPQPAQPAQPAPPQGQPAPDGQQPLPPQVVYQPQDQQAPPPAQQWVYSYPSGQWVFTSEYGWIWVPAGAETTPEEGVPYTYLYTPTYGWNWYISPWGVGPYHYGVWVRHPWRPVGWRGGWVAGPRVFVHLGGHAGYRGRVVVHGGYVGGHPGHWGGGGHRR